MLRSGDNDFVQPEQMTSTSGGNHGPFGQRLREVRSGAGMSLRDVERRSGLQSGYLSQLERGKIAHPGPTVLRSIAAGYGVRYEDVLSWTGYAPAADSPSPRQAVAMSAIAALGEPSEEELETLTAIVNLLQTKRQR
jgi:transcriptional regulator with XRE-family HTH domain